MASSSGTSYVEVKFNKEFLSKLVHDYYSPNSELVDFELKKRNIHGENFISSIYQLILKITEENAAKTVPMIIKALPTNPLLLNSALGMKAFEKEVAMFQQIFPELMSVDNRFTSVPKHVSSSLDKEATYVLMEDLTAKGFKMADRFSGLDLDHSKLVISEMAKFHALSFIKFQGKGTCILEKYPDLAERLWVAPDVVPERYRLFVNCHVEKIKQLLKEEDKEHVIPRVERHFDKVFERMNRQVVVPEKFPAVVNFGDCWTSNFMFNYDEKGKPTSVKFLDFQLARVTSRCSDLSYFLFTSINMAVLNENFNELLKTYHESFNAFITSHDCGKGASLLQFNGDELTWEYFNMEFEQYRSYGTTSALLYTPLMLESPDTAPDLDKISVDDLRKHLGTDQSSSGATQIWKDKAIREKLLTIASGHLPMCFKPLQTPQL